jgi:hypothetical protein
MGVVVAVPSTVVEVSTGIGVGISPIGLTIPRT